MESNSPPSWPGLGMPPAWKQVVRRGLRRARVALSDAPVFLPVVLRLTPRGTSRAIRQSTGLVVEGFPRSSNTFAVGALAIASSGTFKVSGHVHTPSQVRLAVRRRVPTLVVIRNPRAVVQSLIVAAPHVRPRQAVLEWLHFYEEIWPLRDGFVVATFEQVISDMSEVASRVERRFGIEVPRFGHSTDEMKRLDEHMVAEHRRWHPSDIRSAPWPSDERAAEAQRVALLLDDARLLEQWAAADDLYGRYQSEAGAGVGGGVR